MHPFGYPEGGLDVEETRQLGYEGFKGITLADGTRHSGCAFGAFNAIIGQLREKVGIPEKPGDYDLTLGEGLVVGDDDKESIGEFIGLAHSANYTQEQVTAGLNWYYKNSFTSLK